MATNKWRGDAPAVKMVATVQITGNDATTTYKITCNGKVVSVPGNAGGANSTASDLQAALAASTIPEFLECTYTVGTSIVTITSGVAGRPFTMTSSVSGGAGTIGAVTTTTTSSGPNDWNLAQNWTLGAVPVATNDVVIENSSVDILYNLSQAGATLASLTIKASYTGKIGLPEYNASGYQEYRTTYLTIDATDVVIGQGAGAGSGRIKINAGTVATTVTVFSMAASVETGVDALLWKGTNAANVVNCYKGTMGVASFAGETATIATLRIGQQGNLTGDASVRLSSGVTLTTVDKVGGVLEMACGATTVTQTSGTITILKASPAPTFTTVTSYGGTVYMESSSTITTLNLAEGATFDASRDQRAKTITNCNLYGSMEGKITIVDPDNTVTWTNGLVFNRMRPSDCNLDDLFTHKTLSIA